MKKNTMTRFGIPLALALLLSGSGSAAVAFLTEGGDEAIAKDPMAMETTALFISMSYFTGAHCYITCIDETYYTVEGNSTDGCCSSCLDLCNVTSCASQGQGTSVLCEA